MKLWTVLLPDMDVYFSTEKAKTFPEKIPVWKSRLLHRTLYTPILVSITSAHKVLPYFY